MNSRRFSLLVVTASLATLLAACGGGNGNNNPPLQISVAFTSGFTPPGSMTVSTTAGIAATVTNDSKNLGVTWSCTPASACGSFNPSSTASTVPTTYTAPAAVPSGGTVTIIATSVADTTKSASQQVTINAAAAISVTLTTKPPSSLPIQSTAGIVATVANDSQNKGVTWSCTPASACGSFNPTSTASGSATTYTAPASVPTGATVTVTATSVTDTTKSASATITITSTAISVILNSPPPSSMNVSQTASVVATVANDSQNQGVTWSCTPASACGSFNPTSTASGSATTYTAPASIPATNPVTVTATSVTDPTKSASASVTITAAGSISVTLTTPPPTSLLIQGTASVVATVSNDSSNAGVTWSVTCGSAGTCGSFNPTSTASGASTTYTAPSVVPDGNTVTITATSNATGSTASASAVVTITSNVTVAFSTNFGPPNPAVLNINQTWEFAATTANDPNNTLGNNIVNWTVTCGTPGSCGNFSSTSTGNNVQTTYTAPSAIPSGNTVTITATSITDFNKSVNSGAITIQLPPPLLPAGTYVFQVAGEDANGAPNFTPFSVAGAFTVNNASAITGGEEDFTDATFSSSESILASGGGTGTTITATTDGNLQIVLDTGDTGNIGNGTGLETLNITLTSSTSGLISWFDGFATGTGTFSIQDSIAAGTTPVGGYALLSSGYEVTNSNLYNLAIGGIPVVAGDGSITGLFDVNDTSQTVQTQVPFAAGSGVTAPDSFGRVQFTFVSTLPQIQLAGYIVNASTIDLVEVSDSYLGFTGGAAFAQGANTGTFSNNSVLNSSYTFALQGDDSQPFAQFAGTLAFSTLNPTDLAVSGTATLNDIANQTTGAVSGTIKVDSTGRATIFSLTLGGVAGQIQLYLDGNGNALVATMHKNYVLAGPAFQQTASAAVSGSYAMNGIGVSGFTLDPWSAVGPILNISTGTIGANSFTDFNYFDQTLAVSPCPGTGSTCPAVPLSGTLTTTAGTITGLGADSLLTGPATSDTFDVYPIDSSHAFAIENDSTQLGLLYLAPYTATPNAAVIKPATSTASAKAKAANARTVQSQTAK